MAKSGKQALGNPTPHSGNDTGVLSFSSSLFLPPALSQELSVSLYLFHPPTPSPVYAAEESQTKSIWCLQGNSKDFIGGFQPSTPKASGVFFCLLHTRLVDGVGEGSEQTLFGPEVNGAAPKSSEMC